MRKKILFILILLSISLVSAGKTTFNSNPNLKLGDIWNDRIITQISVTDRFYTIYWEKLNCIKLNKENGTVNIFMVGENYPLMKDYGFWVLNTLKNETPFNGFTYNLYYEKTDGLCKNIKRNDVKIFIGETEYYGFANFNSDKGYWYVVINKELKNKKWRFLIMHELGHVYTRWGHSHDGSIMDSDGGDEKFRDYQINLMRVNLNA
jgi:hypothetical protein